MVYSLIMLTSVVLLNVLTLHRAAAKEEAAEDGKKKRGGISMPEEWPWEEAKKFFEHPDVTPADEIEVRAPKSLQ